MNIYICTYVYKIIMLTFIHILKFPNKNKYSRFIKICQISILIGFFANFSIKEL